LGRQIADSFNHTYDHFISLTPVSVNPSDYQRRAIRFCDRWESGCCANRVERFAPDHRRAAGRPGFKPVEGFEHFAEHRQPAIDIVRGWRTEWPCCQRYTCITACANSAGRPTRLMENPPWKL